MTQYLVREFVGDHGRELIVAIRDINKTCVHIDAVAGQCSGIDPSVIPDMNMKILIGGQMRRRHHQVCCYA